MKQLLQVHEDVITVPEVIRKMANAYADEGYQVERLTPMNFKITLQGGWVHIYWQDGKIWQEIVEEEKGKNVAESESAKVSADAKANTMDYSKVITDSKKAVLKKEVQKISKEIIFERPEAYVYSSVSLTGVPDDVKNEIYKKHEQFWKEILQTIEVYTGLVDKTKEDATTRETQREYLSLANKFHVPIGVAMEHYDIFSEQLMKFKTKSLESKDSEDKEMICRLLCEVLQKTRGCSDLYSLHFDQDEIVTAIFKSGSQKINVACDSGIAMIRDIVNHLRL